MDNFFDYTFHYLKKRFENFASVKDSKLLLLKNNDEDFETMAKTQYRSEIFVYGKDITVRLQLFFKPDQIISTFPHLDLRSQDNENYNKIYDFFNEVCNMSCGKVKSALEESGMLVALSLPISVETHKVRKILTSEVLPHYQDVALEYNNQIVLYSRVSLNVNNTEKFEKCNFSTTEEDSSDIEFF